MESQRWAGKGEMWVETCAMKSLLDHENYLYVPSMESEDNI
jgi:hypothetical protein